MQVRKLSAISSTNDYLKVLLTQTELENFAVVVADYQDAGKGQGANIWHSEKGKNLLFSILVKFNDLPIYKSAYLNFAIAIGIFQILNQYLPKVKIKWPNDIMADDKKICGILIENTIRSSKIKHSIIGVGLNVNQIDFPFELSNATSFTKLLKKEFDKELLLEKIIASIKNQINLLNYKNLEALKFTYENFLYRKGSSFSFSYSNGESFLGTILGVSEMGLLRIEFSDGSIKEFANKELIFNISKQ